MNLKKRNPQYQDGFRAALKHCVTMMKDDAIRLGVDDPQAAQVLRAMAHGLGLEIHKDKTQSAQRGYNALWGWFGLSYASWLTLPRVLMHEMPDEWQEQMAQLLKELGEEFPHWQDFETYVSIKKNNKFVNLPEHLCNYRHPRREEIDALRKAPEASP